MSHPLDLVFQHKPQAPASIWVVPGLRRALHHVIGRYMLMLSSSVGKERECCYNERNMYIYIYIELTLNSLCFMTFYLWVSGVPLGGFNFPRWPVQNFKSASPWQFTLYTVLFETLDEMTFLLISNSKVFGETRTGNRAMIHVYPKAVEYLLLSGFIISGGAA